MLWSELQWDQPAFFGLAGLGGMVLLATRPRTGLPLVTWAVLSFGLLLVYSPLGIKHAALQLPPTALLAGAGLGALWQEVRGCQRGVRRKLALGMAGLVGLIGAAYLVGLPTEIGRDRQA